MEVIKYMIRNCDTLKVSQMESCRCDILQHARAESRQTINFIFGPEVPLSTLKYLMVVSVSAQLLRDIYPMSAVMERFSFNFLL